MSTPAVNPEPEQQSTRPKWIGNASAYVSLLCSLVFWLGFVLSHFPIKFQAKLAGFDWMRTMAAAVFLAAVARLFHAKAWKLALTVALVTAFFVMYATGG